MEKFKNLTSDLSNINYGESDGSLFITTPELLSPLSLVSNDNYSLVDKSSTSLNVDKIYGPKVLKMSESIFSNLFRHAEKVRIKNHVQEKMLHEKINGHKGIEQKLHENLTKIEKTRQCLEEELFYMEKEMKALGLNNSKAEATKRRNSTPANNNHVSELKINPPENMTINEISRKNSTLNEIMQQRQKSSLTLKSFDYSDIDGQNSVVNNMDNRSSITNLSFFNSELARRRHTWIKTNPQNQNENLNNRMDKKYTRKGSSLVHFAHEPLHYKPIIRKHSLGNHPISHNNSLSKSRSQSVYLSDPITLAKNTLATSSSSDISVFGDNSSVSPTPSQLPGSEIMTNKTTNEPVYSPRILQLPKIDEIYAERKKRSRKVSFTQVDINELEIPKTYMHSNEALEKYKFNPNYYLPDGTLKTKFLLPQLRDSYETVKNCRYIRQYSIDGSQDDQMDKNDYDVVKYVFHDTEIPSIE